MFQLYSSFVGVLITVLFCGIREIYISFIVLIVLSLVLFLSWYLTSFSIQSARPENLDLVLIIFCLNFSRHCLNKIMHNLLQPRHSNPQQFLRPITEVTTKMRWQLFSLSVIFSLNIVGFWYLGILAHRCSVSFK